MSETDLVRYFMEQTNKRFDDIECKLDLLLQFKWQIIGGSLVASTLLTVAFNILFLLMGGK